MKYGWLTDIHLEFMKDRLATRFVKGLAAEKLDGLFLTGDISTTKRLEFHLQAPTTCIGCQPQVLLN